MDVVYLLGCALGVAIVCMLLSLWNVKKWPGSHGARHVLEERARAKTELRLRGGNSQRNSEIGHNIPSPDTLERKFYPRRDSSRSSSQTLDSKAHLVVGNGPAMNDFMFQKPATNFIRPKLSLSKQNTSRASRGYSVYSINDAKRPPARQNSSSFMAQVPTLTNNDSGQSTPSYNVNGSDLELGERPAHARPAPPQRSMTGLTRVVSTSLGAGTYLSRHRSHGDQDAQANTRLSMQRSLRAPAGPRAIDPTHGRTSPSKVGDLTRSTGTRDLAQQAMLDPQTSSSDQSSGTRGRSPDGSSALVSSGGSSHSHSSGPRPMPSYSEGHAPSETLSQQHGSTMEHPLLPRAPASAGRSRPMAYYERSDVADGSSQAHHFTHLLEQPQARQYGR